MPVILAELESRDASGAVTMIYLATHDYNHPSAPGFYLGRLRGSVTWTRSCYAGGTTSGAVTIGYGRVVAVNPDGALDGLQSGGYAGGRCVLKWLESVESAYSTAITLATLTLEQPEVTFNEISFLVRDRLQDFETRKLQTTRYAGTTTSSGIEGGPDLKGKVKPDLHGLCRDASPYLVNQGKQIYQVKDGAAEIFAVYDRGAAVTNRGADYSSQADMEANAPTTGQYRSWPAGGCMRLGFTPAGIITVDARAGSGAADRTAAQILKAIALSSGGLTSGQISAADLAALDAVNPAVIGFYARDEISVRAALEPIANSVGAWFGFDRLGVLRMKRFEAPTGSPVISLRRMRAGYGEEAIPANAADILSIERVPLEDPGRGVPIQTANLTYGRCWTPQTSDLAGSVQTDQTRRSFLAEESRKVTATDAGVLLQFPGAGVREFDGLIDEESAAQAEADRRLTLHKIRRDRFQAETPVTPDLIAAVDLASTVEIKLDRFGMSAGKPFAAIGITVSVGGDKPSVELDLWG